MIEFTNLGTSFSSTWLKAIISSFVFNDGQSLMKILGVEQTDDFDQEIVEFLAKYIQEFETNKKKRER